MSEKANIMSEKKFRLIDIIRASCTFVAFLFFFIYNFGASYVPSLSMYPTLKVGTVFYFKIINPDDISYDNIVTFFPYETHSTPIKNGFEVIYYQHVEKQVCFVKRVVGLGGDVIEVKDGVVYRNGQPINPKYENEPANEDFGPYTVPLDHIFVMGDNRNYSSDSRVFGALPENQFYGKLIVKYPSFVRSES